MNSQKQPASLNKANAIAVNRTPVAGMQPLLDFLSASTRRRITAVQLEKYIYRMAGISSISNEYGRMLKKASSHPTACLNVISQLLRRKIWTEDEKYAGILVDLLKEVGTERARALARHAADIFSVPIAKQRAKKFGGTA